MNMKILLTFIVVFFLFAAPTSAHPGGTASDGCHYCKTNCDKWGEAWGERHCHGGGSEQTSQPIQQSQPEPNPYIRPIKISIPTKVPTAVPTSAPLPTPTLSSTPTPTIRPTSMDLGTTDSSSDESSDKSEDIKTEPLTATETTVGLGVLGSMGYGALWIGKKILARFIS